MSVFDDANDILFADTNAAETVIYSGAGTDAEVSITIVFASPTREANFGESGAVVREHRAWVRLSEVSDPARGDTLERGDDLYTVERVERDANDIAATLFLKKN